MKAVLLMLVACGAPEPVLQTQVVMRGLQASAVRSVELFIVQGSGIDCDALLTPRGPFVEGAVLRGSALVTIDAVADIPSLPPGAYFAVAHAYDAADGLGSRIGEGCAATGVLAAGETKRLTVSITD